MLLSLSGLYYFASNYDKGFPALSIDIKMNHEMALKPAENLSLKHNKSKNICLLYLY